jgi:glucokinase
VIGVDFGGTKVEIVLATDVSVVLDRVRLPSHAERGSRQLLERTGAAATELFRAARRRGVEVVGCAAVSPGVILPDQVLLAPNLPGWDRVALRDWLNGLLPVDITAVDNDVRAGALAELRAGALAGVDPGIYLSLGTGVAAALTVAGRVVRGAHGASGEIGYTTLTARAASNGADGRGGMGGAHGPGGADGMSGASGDLVLEDLVGARAIETRASALLGTPMTIESLARRSDRAAARLIHDAASALAVALSNLAVVIDPQRVVVGGGVAATLAQLVPILETRLRHIVPFPPEVVPARFVGDASVRGAIALAVDAVADRHVAATARGVEPRRDRSGEEGGTPCS